MHHKFAVVDNLILINGSLNWTSKGVRQNHENVMITGSKMFIQEFTSEFDRLWKKYSHNQLSQNDSLRKVQSDRHHCMKKRTIKDKHKRLKLLEKKFEKLGEINTHPRLPPGLI
jgi:phosphatidylserine/phosphatidylglycerophosphate/cardiolipin synthase-like enzyme